MGLVPSGPNLKSLPLYHHLCGLSLRPSRIMPVTTPSDPQAAALLAHVLEQTQTNINFLASQNYITHAEASDLISRLTQGGPQDSLVSSMNSLAVGPARTPDPARRSVPPPPPRNSVQKARAQWAYNEDGRVSLSYCAPSVVSSLSSSLLLIYTILLPYVSRVLSPFDHRNRMIYPFPQERSLKS